MLYSRSLELTRLQACGLTRPLSLLLHAGPVTVCTVAHSGPETAGGEALSVQCSRCPVHAGRPSLLKEQISTSRLQFLSDAQVTVAPAHN